MLHFWGGRFWRYPICFWNWTALILLGNFCSMVLPNKAYFYTSEYVKKIYIFLYIWRRIWLADFCKLSTYHFMMFLGFQYHKIIIRPRDISTEEHCHHGTAATMRTTVGCTTTQTGNTVGSMETPSQSFFNIGSSLFFLWKAIRMWTGFSHGLGTCSNLVAQPSALKETLELAQLSRKTKYGRSIALTRYWKYSKRKSGFQLLLLMSHLSSG